MAKPRPNPCPACGSRNVSIKKDEWKTEHGEVEHLEIWVHCNNCEQGGAGAETKPAAIELWNHKAEIIK